MTKSPPTYWNYKHVGIFTKIIVVDDNDNTAVEENIPR